MIQLWKTCNIDKYEFRQKKNEIVFKDLKFDAIRSSLSTDLKFKANKDIVWKRPSEFLQPG